MLEPVVTTKTLLIGGSYSPPNCCHGDIAGPSLCQLLKSSMGDLVDPYSVAASKLVTDLMWWFFLFYVLVFKNFFVLLAPYVCFHIFS